VVRQLHQIFHEVMMTDQRQNRQHQSISGNRKHRPKQIAETTFRVAKCISATKQRAMNHKTPAPARWRNQLKCHRLVTPDEPMPSLNHAAKEILVLAASSELTAKRRLRRIENGATEKDVSRAALVPRHQKSSRVSWPLIKSTLNEPFRRFVLEVGLHRTENAGSLIGFARAKKIQQPARRGEFVVINEHNEIARRLGNGAIAGQGNVTFRFHSIGDGDRTFSAVLIYSRPSGVGRVVICDYH